MYSCVITDMIKFLFIYLLITSRLQVRLVYGKIVAFRQCACTSCHLHFLISA